MSSTDYKIINRNIDKFYKKGNIQKAIELCQFEIAKDPVNPAMADLHVKLGDLYMEWHLDKSQTNDYIDEAITQYQQAMELNIKSAELYYKIGRAFYYKNEINKAINYFNNAAETDENYADAYYFLAFCYAERNEIFKAKECVEKTLKLSKTRSSAYLLFAKLLYLHGESTLKNRLKCLFAVLIAITVWPFNKEEIKNVLKMAGHLKFFPVLVRAFIYEVQDKYEEAIEIYKRAIEEAPRITLFYELLGNAYIAINKDDDAICEFKMAIWLNSLDINAYKALCLIYEAQEDYDSAIDVCRKLIKIQPFVSAYYSELAGLLYAKDDIEGAISNYQNALTLDTNANSINRDAQLLGYVLHKGDQNYDAAISSYELARVTAPNDVDIYINLGNAFYDKGEYENAQIVYKRALEVEPYNAKIHCNLGYLYWGCGVIDEAIKSYEASISYDPDYAIPYNNLGVIYLDDLGRVKQAVELFEKAIEANPNYALAYYNLARTKAITSNKVEAAKLYQIAYDLNKFSNEIDEAEILDKIQKLFS